MPSPEEIFTPLTVPALIDPHYHAREGDVVGPLLEAAYTGGAAVVGCMPNTSAGLLTSSHVRAYHERCGKVGPGFAKLQQFTFLQLTPRTTKDIIDSCITTGITSAKVYPFNRTTKSQNGVRDYHDVLKMIVYACKKGMNVHFHPEHPNPMIENRDAEYLFLPIIDMIMRETEGLPGAIVCEHGTDARCIPFWKEWGATGRFYVTLTAHHLATSENETFGDVQATCKPPIKTRYDRQALVDLVKEGHAWVMAGTDSAAHDESAKHVVGPCACGAFTAPFAMALYAHVLRELLLTPAGLQIFTAFTSSNAKRLHGISDDRMVTIEDRDLLIPQQYQVGPWTVEPFWAGQTISCTVSWN